MSAGVEVRRRGQVMMLVGLLGVLAGLAWLLWVADPFPMWLILAGGGLVFLGAGAGIARAAD